MERNPRFGWLREETVRKPERILGLRGGKKQQPQKTLQKEAPTRRRDLATLRGLSATSDMLGSSFFRGPPKMLMFLTGKGYPNKRRPPAPYASSTCACFLRASMPMFTQGAARGSLPVSWNVCRIASLAVLFKDSEFSRPPVVRQKSNLNTSKTFAQAPRR